MNKSLSDFFRNNVRTQIEGHLFFTVRFVENPVFAPKRLADRQGGFTDFFQEIMRIGSAVNIPCRNFGLPDIRLLECKGQSTVIKGFHPGKPPGGILIQDKDLA